MYVLVANERKLVHNLHSHTSLTVVKPLCLSVGPINLGT